MNVRHARQHADGGEQDGRDHERTTARQHLIAESTAEIFVVTTSGEQRGTGRNQQRGNLRNQTITDGERGERLGCIADRHALLRDADDDAADDVDGENEQAGDGITANELGGTVHGAVKARVALHTEATLAGFLLGDVAGAEIGVDGHLLTRHRVQSETSGDFRNALGTFGDDDEVHDDEDEKDDRADDEVAADGKIAEGRNDSSGGVLAHATVGENQSC